MLDKLSQLVFKEFITIPNDSALRDLREMVENISACPVRSRGRKKDQVMWDCLRGKAIEYAMEQVGFERLEPEGGNIDSSDPETFAIDLFHPVLNVKLECKYFGPHAVYGFLPKTKEAFEKYHGYWDFLLAAGSKRAPGGGWREWIVIPKLIVPSEHLTTYIVKSSRVNKYGQWDGTYKFDHDAALEQGHCAVNFNSGGISVKRSERVSTCTV